MIDGRFDSAFHQAFVASETHAMELPIPTWAVAAIMAVVIGTLATLFNQTAS